MRAIDYFDKAAAANPHRTAIVANGASYSYQEVQRLTARIARAMWASGLRQGEPVAVYSPNNAEVLLCVLGLMRAGGVWVPVNPRNSLVGNLDYMNHVETAWLFYHSSFHNIVDEIKMRVPKIREFVCMDTEDSDTASLNAFMSRGDGADDVDWGEPCGNPDRLMGLFQTGGTTGAAKAVQMTTLPWATTMEMGAHYWGRGELSPLCLSVTPLTHGAGFMAMTTFTLGGTNVVMPKFDPGEVLRNIERLRVTHLFLPPTAFYMLLTHPDVRRFNYLSLQVFLLVGSPVSPDKLREGIEIFGPCICQSYGQMEAPMLLTWLDGKTLAAAAAGDHPERLGSCGKETYAVRVAVMDDAGRLQPPSQRGEIVARGNLVTPGYYRNREATAAAQAYGWHHTGDIGYMDEDGYFYIVDRKKDMIITGGFNVFSAEVEAAVMELIQTCECAVVGVPDDKWGEAVKAIVVLRDGESLTEGDVINHCRQRLGAVKAPTSVEFRREIPKTSVGKVDKSALRRPYWAGVDRSVH